MTISPHAPDHENKIEHNILVIYPFPLKRVCTIGYNRYDAYVLFYESRLFSITNKLFTDFYRLLKKIMRATTTYLRVILRVVSKLCLA